MSFLEDYDKIPKTDPQAQTALTLKALRTDWRNFFAELRANRSIFAPPPFTFITRWSDVIQALTQPELFSVRANRPKMDPSMGPLMLARDGTQHNWHEKSVMRSILRWDDLHAVRAMVGMLLNESLSVQNGRVELVSKVGRFVPLRIVQRYFGFPGPDDATMLRWSKATQSDMFRNPGNDPTIHATNVQAGEEMRRYVLQLLAEKWSQPESGQQDPVSRLTRMVRAGDTALAAERVVSNVCGLLIGAIETMSQAIVQAIEQILLRPDVFAAALDAARAGNIAVLDPIVWEALRFNPITSLVFRVCERDTVLGAGTPHESTIPKGRLVAVCIASAMFDAAMFPEPDTFKAGRPFDSYLHFGFGTHECLGKHVGIVAIPEAVRRVLLLPGLHTLPGEEGKIDFQNGPFPERYLVGCTPSA